ncbi:MAG TPA: hypothetical protein VLA17_05545 [Candidatus Limnocylindria bacterium]|nr:hypothetical protein [Candidatus Limnocylindria bacterium]
MPQLNEPIADASLQLEEMLNIPIEHQTTLHELTLLGTVLQNGLQSLENADTREEACEIIRQMLKCAFVIGRRHSNLMM